MESKIYKFGIIGCGAIAAMHAEVIKKLLRGHLAGVFSPSIERTAAFAKRYGCCAFRTVGELHAAVDIAVICTPSGLHAEGAVAALRAGCHVLIEKPMALTEEGVRAILEAERETGRVVAVVSQQRFSPAVRALHRLITEGRLGRLLLADLSMLYHRDPSYYQAVAWRGTRAMDGGELFNQGVHGVDLLLHLCGDVTAVAGATRTLVHSIEAEDTTVAMLELSSGAVATLRSTTASHDGYPRRLTLSFTEGTVVLDDDRITVWDVPSIPCPDVTVDEGRAAHRDPMAFSCEYHLLEATDLIAALDEGRAPLLSSAEGRRAPELILAIYRAAERGERIAL